MPGSQCSAPRLDPIGEFDVRGRPTTWGLVLGALLVLFSLSWAASAAQAGQYTVWSCRGPAFEPISAEAWHVTISDAAASDLRAADECASGGPLLIEATPTEALFNRSPTGEAIFEPPAGTLITTFDLWRYAAANDNPSTPESTDDWGSAIRHWWVGAGGEGFSFECAFFRHDPRCSYGSAEEPFSEANLVDEQSNIREPPPLEKLGFWVSCLRSGCEPAGLGEGPTAIFDLYRAAVTIEDDHAPTVGRLAGPLTEPVPVTGAANLVVTATDEGGGVASFEFGVDGGTPQRVAATTAIGCEEPYSASQPCPSSATESFSVDTSGLAPGGHVIAGSAVDAAGNSTPFGPISFTVASPPAPAPPIVEGSHADQPDNGTPAVQAPGLQLSRSHGRRQNGKAARLQGSLTTPEGVPIAGARLSVEITELGAARHTRSLEVITGGDGGFAFDVVGQGARSVVVSYSPIVGGPASRSVDTLVKAPLTLHLTTRPRRASNGQVVQFRGRLEGAGAAARGATAEIQAITDGHWATVENVTIRGDGTFAWSHRFRYIDRNALFSFRVVVPRTPGWPWPTVRSRRVKLPIAAAPR